MTAQTTDRAAGPDTATRRELYRTMVLIRSFEEAILADYHADKKPAWTSVPA